MSFLNSGWAFLRRRRLAFSALLFAFVTALAYGAALWLPFFYDDLQHLVWLRDQTPLSIFVGQAGRTYYRPMQFFAWSLYETIFGRDSALAYHALNLILHTINALLVVALTRRLFARKDRWWPAILAGLIFVVFPFSYQVVPLPASLTHPLATLCVLLAILAYDRFQATGTWWWLLAALICSVFAFMSNEGSILVAGLIVLFVWIRSPRQGRWRWIGLFVLLAAAYYLWYQGQQADNSGMLGTHNLETLFQNSVYMLEGLSFPLQPVSQGLMSFGAGDQAAALLVALITLAGLAVLLFRTRRFRLFVFGAGWYGLCVTPAILLLSHNYLINSPRLMYLGSVGVAVLWASAVEAIWDIIQPLRIRCAVTVAVAIGILIPAFVFVRQRMDLYTLTAAPLQAVLDTVERSQPGTRLLFANLPAWLGPATGWYPIGHEGVLFLQQSISMDDLLMANLGYTLPTTAIEFDNLATPQAYYYGIYGPKIDWGHLNEALHQSDDVYLTRYEPARIRLMPAGRVTHAEFGSMTARLGSQLELGSTTVIDSRDTISVTLNWRITQSVNQDLSVFVHVYGPDGKLVTQSDGYPLLGMAPFANYQPGQTLQDRHTIDWPKDAPAGTYHVGVGVYDRGTGQRLEMRDASGNPLPDDTATIAVLNRP